ncbi:heterokaryon incompatibility protein-domain-containing protein [Podospora aff. communis PSN243]|uniref:Heterokaryon incompatibility protein-domain-containing protein n=1 Tax=Podospora aff. communis PSN243 TaxID=3040156 RepID=A0AAV9G761_9PEZI|nr:heterokaryon incompatibility protein-domain-containing protein [Podospora aff. communis PSN243]
MCQKIHARFRCAEFHEGYGEPEERFKRIKDCAAFQKGIDCKEWGIVYEPDEDEHDQYCPECSGLRPLAGKRPKIDMPAESDDKPAGMRPESQRITSRLKNASCEDCSTGSLHHMDSSLAIFEEKAAAGCNFASVILEGLDRFGIARSSVTNISNQHYRVGRIKLNTLGPTSQQSLQFCTLRHSPWPEMKPGVFVPEDPFSSSCMQQMRIWLQDCLHSHQDCKRPEAAWSLPTRVIDVGSRSDDAPFLYISNREAKPYTTLSYRWGSDMRCLATTQNLARLQKGIDWDRLPPTFQDAIRITRYLRIRYLWIDALCIVQNDEEDWRRESGRMASIYGNSTLTLSATSSASPSDGLSLKRPSVVYEHLGPDGANHSVHVRGVMHHDFIRRSYWGVSSDWDRDKYHTLWRGWCFQERLLSTRVLHFTHCEMVWDCRSSWCCECDPVLDSDGGPSVLRRFDRFRQAATTKRREELDNDSGGLYWTEILREFSTTRLAYDSDKLPAISGIARSLSGSILGRYYAGLWEYNLVHQLMWYRRPSGIPRSFGKPSTEYIAPTFSPLSRPAGRVAFFGGRDNDIQTEVNGVHVTPLNDSDPTGAVADGYITLSGPLLAIFIDSMERHKFPQSGYRIKFRAVLEPGALESLTWTPDADGLAELVKPNDKLLLLQIEASYSLVLRKSDSGVLNRIGCTRSTRLIGKEMEHAVRTTVTIH